MFVPVHVKDFFLVLMNCCYTCGRLENGRFMVSFYLFRLNEGCFSARTRLFPSLSCLIWKAVFQSAFLLAAPVSLVKAMEWLANRRPSHPSNLESSFSHNNFTRPGETSVSSKDMGAHCKRVSFNVKKKRKRNFFYESMGVDNWDLGTVKAYIKHIHSIQISMQCTAHGGML